ncbi:MAG: hypothetical protein GYA23_04460 [Methanomicrobiales archaeon]|nr:hypothetical protein [Methanomicrobiales archaeon]
MSAIHHDAGRTKERPGRIRLGVDFGVTATVIAVSENGAMPTTIAFPGVSREFPAPSKEAPVHIIPSVIEYHQGRQLRLGNEVLASGTPDSPATARWFRRYLCGRSPVLIPAGDGHLVRYEVATADFLLPLLVRALQVYPEAELVFSVPPDTPGEYEDLLRRIAASAGARSTSTIREPAAALAGYGCLPGDDEPVLMVTFSEAELEVSVLAGPPHDGGGQRILAQAQGSCSCSAVDGWIARDLLHAFRLMESDPRAIRLMPQIRTLAALLREHAPGLPVQEIRLCDPLSKKTFSAVFTPDDLHRILEEHDTANCIHDCLDRALSAIRIHGAVPGDIRHVILLGEGCAIPRVQEIIRARFPGARQYDDHVVDAVARGAACHETKGYQQDRITRSYALRYWNESSREHQYRYLVHGGTPYPSAGQVARVVISAAYDGQTHLGIPLYEVGSEENGVDIEFVTDHGGGVRLAGPGKDADSKKQAVFVNERSPTLLVATPPARKDEPRFECTFTIDEGRNLCLSARDLITGKLVKLNVPVYRMN